MTAARFAAGIFAGFALVAVVNAVAIVALVPPAAPLPLAAGGLGLRAAHLFFDAAETLGVGAVLALVGGAFVRFVRLPSWAMWCVGVAVTVAIALATIREFLERTAAQLFDGRFPSLVFVAYLALLGVGFPEVVRVAVELAERPRLRLALVALAVLGLVADQLHFRDDYFGIHGLAAGAAAMVGGAGLAPAAQRTARALGRSLAGRGVLGALGAVALFGIGWPPPNAVRYELFRQPSAIAPWILAQTVWTAPRLHAPAPVTPPASPWDADRAKAPAAAPTRPAVFAGAPAVVVLVTIDALRGDVVNDPANDALFPALAQLKRDGVVFTHASAPGSQTPVSLSTLFSGLYFSEQKWALHGVGSTRYLYPAADPFPRFPELLSARGVTTGIFGGLAFLAGDYGVARGFQEEDVVVQGRRHAQARELLGPLLDRLKRAARSPGAPPLFLFTHLMDAHAPYDRGRKDGTDYERYLSEVAIADAAVGEVARALARQFGDRWALFVSADHGEAFGEHGTTGHAKTLYEELLHVPLLARSPRFAPRTIDARVGLIDLGPTILDLFGVDTPATFNGQSLVPLLAGGAAPMTRPLLAEGRFRRALTEPDGFKVIEDPRRKVVETYDLVADPGETRNLFDAEPSRSDAALAALRAFFDARVRTRRDAGYAVPYEP